MRLPGVILALLATTSLAAPALSAPVNPSVIGGTPAVAGAWPSITPLLFASVDDPTLSQFCGGTVVAPHWVLTAAHCVTDVTRAGTSAPGDIHVAPGALDLPDVTPGTRVALDAVVAHAAYNDITFSNDIALLRTGSAMSAPGMSIPAPDEDVSIVAGAPAQAAGWGAMSYDIGTGAGNYANELMQATLPLIDDTACNTAYGNDTTVQLCAGYLAGGTDTCSGDSGGPLTLAIAGQTRLIGLTSYGQGCALNGFPGVYTRTTAFREWVCAHITTPASITARQEGSAVRVDWTAPSNCPWQDPQVVVQASPGGYEAYAPLSAATAVLSDLPAGTYEISARVVGAAPVIAARMNVTIPGGGSEARNLSLVEAPQVMGTPRVGTPVSVNPGRWTGSPEVSATWQRQVQGAWQDIATAPALSYTPVAADAGLPLRVLVHARAGAEMLTQATEPSALVTMLPVFTRIAPFRGPVRVGIKVRAPRVTVTAAPTATVHYHWQRSVPGGWRAIRGATRASYTPRSADAGHRLRVRYEARNAVGTVVARSTRSAFVRPLVVG